MKKLFYWFIRENKIKDTELVVHKAGQLSARFNKWIVALGHRRNKTIHNEANKFMIRKWIVNGDVKSMIIS